MTKISLNSDSVSELTQGSFMMDHYESLTMKDHWTDD